MLTFTKFAIFATILLLRTEFAQSTSVYLFYRSSNELHFIEGPILPTGEINWGSDNTVYNTDMSFGPTAIVFNNIIYVFHQGYGEDGQLWLNKYNPSNGAWAGDTQLSITETVDGVAAVVLDGVIYVFYGDSAHAVWEIHSSDGTSFSAGRVISDEQWLTGTPTAIVLHDEIYLIFTNGQLIYYSLFLPGDFLNNLYYLDIGATNGPQAIVLNELAYVFHQSQTQGQLAYFTFDIWGLYSDNPIQPLVQPIAANSGPAPAYINGYIYSFYVGSNGLVYYTAITLSGGIGPVDQVFPILNAVNELSVVVF